MSAVDPGHNRLAALAADIRAAHADVTRGALAVAERALGAGRMLLEAKAAVSHGKWADWLQANTGISARTARRYMQLVKSGVETATVADLGVKGAATKLALSRVPRPALGQTAFANYRREIGAFVWRDAAQPDRFHVMVLGRINGQDDSAAATRHPVPDELLSRTIGESGFPLGGATFHLGPFKEVHEMFRFGIVAGQDTRTIDCRGWRL